LLEALRKIVKPVVYRGNIVIPKMVIGRGRRLHACQLGLVDDHGVEPIFQRHARATRRLFGGFARFRTDLFGTPRDAKFHCSHPRSRRR
jgi:hypothetical protein